MQIINLMVFLYSKCQKWGKMANYWKRKKQEYNERLDEGAITDSQDELDHGVHPTDPNVMGQQKK